MTIPGQTPMGHCQHCSIQCRNSNSVAPRFHFHNDAMRAITWTEGWCPQCATAIELAESFESYNAVASNNYTPGLELAVNIARGNVG